MSVEDNLQTKHFKAKIHLKIRLKVDEGRSTCSWVVDELASNSVDEALVDKEPAKFVCKMIYQTNVDDLQI